MQLQVEAGKSFMDNYGPWGFGICAVCVLLSLFALLIKQLLPVFIAGKDAMVQFALATKSLENATASLERQTTESAALSRQLAEILARLKVLETKGEQ